MREKGKVALEVVMSCLLSALECLPFATHYTIFLLFSSSYLLVMYSISLHLGNVKEKGKVELECLTFAIHTRCLIWVCFSLIGFIPLKVQVTSYAWEKKIGGECYNLASHPCYFLFLRFMNFCLYVEKNFNIQ